MTVRILEGDSRDLIHRLPDNSVHCVVTSPPYFGLRDYGAMGQMGLEASPAEYVAQMAGLFREVWRVLRDDGTLWINIGDSYANDSKWGGTTGGKHVEGLHGLNPTRERRTTGIAAKSLIGIPWRVAFALQDDGWTLRQEIIWAKPNPMPESVEDRCTKAHEHIFLLTKSARYYFDNVAIEEPVQSDRAPSRKAKPSGAGHVGLRPNGTPYDGTGENRNRRTIWSVPSQPFTGEFCGSCRTFFEGKALARLRTVERKRPNGSIEKKRTCTCGKTDGWIAHFACFPPDLIEPAIKAGTSERGCCAKCGAPWERMTRKTKRNASNSAIAGRTAEEIASSGKWSGDALDGNAGLKAGPVITTETIGWKPTCGCDAGVVPCTVLDPFGGAGTTGLVADRLGRSAVLLELNPDYAEMARQRVRGDATLLSEVS
jgi:DNA modification methylase